MTAPAAVPMDTASEIHELDEYGYGRNRISHITGIPASTVRKVLNGVHQTFDNKLTVRQRQGLIMRGFDGR